MAWAAIGGRLVDDERDAGDRRRGRHDERRGDPFPEKDGREQQDDDRLEGPEEHRDTGADGHQTDQAQGVGDAWIQHAQAAEERWRIASERQTANSHDGREDDDAGGQLHRQEDDRREIL